MRQFYLEYKGEPKLQQLVGEIPWGHNLLVISRTKRSSKKRWGEADERALLTLAAASRITLRNVLELLGIGAPETM